MKTQSSADSRRYIQLILPLQPLRPLRPIRSIRPIQKARADDAKEAGFGEWTDGALDASVTGRA